MKKLFTVLLGVALIATGLMAFNYDKEVAKYLKAHPEASQVIKDALATKQLAKDMDAESAKIVGKLLVKWNSWFAEDQQSSQDETGTRVMTARMFVECMEYKGGYYDRERSTLRLFLVLIFTDDKLVKWNIYMPEGKTVPYDR